MTEQERREGRYRRSQAKRLRNRQENANNLPSVEELFTIPNLLKAGKQCCKNVRWKVSTQQFELTMLTYVAEVIEKLLNGIWKPLETTKFVIHERGKARDIEAPRIKDRLIHKVLTNEVLLPSYKPQMIYNNGASQKGKGYSFAMDTLKQDLYKFYRKYGTNGSIIIFDLHHFFPTASHNEVAKMHEKYVINQKYVNLLNCSEGLKYNGKGLALGCELSQAEMIALPSKLDNYIKCQLHLKYIGHYMDDYYVLVPPEMNAQEILDKIIQKAESQDFTINKSKTKIQPVTKKFKFCKTYFTLTNTGKVIRTKTTDNIKILRRKLNAFKIKVYNGEMDMEAVYRCIQSAISVYKKDENYHNYTRVKRMFYAIFGFDIENKEQYKKIDETLIDRRKEYLLKKEKEWEESGDGKHKKYKDKKSKNKIQQENF